MAQVREKDTLLRSLFPPPSLWGRNALMELGPLPDPTATYSLRVTRCSHVGEKPLQTDSCVCVNHRDRFELDGVYGDFILSLFPIRPVFIFPICLPATD